MEEPKGQGESACNSGLGERGGGKSGKVDSLGVWQTII